MVEEQTRELVREERRLFFKRLAWYRRRVESLEEQAVVDHLTGLRNQRALWRELSRRTAVSSEASPIALVMLDFDMFNEVNEGYGHAVGDAVLRRAAGILRQSAPSPRLAFRYGGEEFVLLLPGDEEYGRAAAEQIRTQIASLNGDLPAVTVSCGVAELDGPVEPWVALDRADAALRAAKRAGRNRVIVAGEADSTDSAYLVEELEHETARRAALALAVATLQVRDRKTAEHCDDVLTLCESMGRRLGFHGPALERLMAGAQLHDVGKVAMPSEILNKPGPLNDDEWAVIREHTVIGERILRSVPEMAEVATIVRHSHEHFDGTGYPDGLAGEQIPLASRVILCADAFHAIRSTRPYREGRPARAAIEEVRASAGSQLDPQVVAALVEVADDVRKRGGTVGASLPRNKRLIALLATLAVGTGTAFGTLPELRHALRSIFGISTVDPGDSFSQEPGTGFTFGPLGDLLSIGPVSVHHSRAHGDTLVPRAKTVTRKHRAAAPRETSRGGSLGLPTAPAGGGSHGPTTLGGHRHPPPTVAPGSSTSPPQPTGGDPGATDSGGDSAPIGDPPTDPVKHDKPGRGRALGKNVPVPRPPAESPSLTHRGRIDPPALGHNLDLGVPAPGNGHHKH